MTKCKYTVSQVPNEFYKSGDGFAVIVEGYFSNWQKYGIIWPKEGPNEVGRIP